MYTSKPFVIYLAIDVPTTPLTLFTIKKSNPSNGPSFANDTVDNMPQGGDPLVPFASVYLPEPVTPPQTPPTRPMQTPSIPPGLEPTHIFTKVDPTSPHRPTHEVHYLSTRKRPEGTMCHPNPCQNGASCHEYGENYSCICTEGFDGTHCQGKAYSSYFRINIYQYKVTSNMSIFLKLRSMSSCIYVKWLS